MMDRRSSHLDTCTFLPYLLLDDTPRGFSCVSPTLNLYHVLRCESFHFLTPTLLSPNFTFPFLTTSASLERSTMVDLEGKL
jgi:hypothetical protein